MERMRAMKRKMDRNIVRGCELASHPYEQRIVILERNGDIATPGDQVRPWWKNWTRSEAVVSATNNVV